MQAFKGTSAGLTTSVMGDLNIYSMWSPVEVKGAEDCRMQIDQLSTSPEYDASLLPYWLWQIRLSPVSVSLQSDEKI